MTIAFNLMPSVTCAGFFDKPAPKDVIMTMLNLAPMIEKAFNHLATN